jgi:hypothetical protein
MYREFNEIAFEATCPINITDEVEEEIATLLLSGEDISEELIKEVLNDNS